MSAAARHPERHPLRAISVQACDGCCCGTARKHPGVDHAGQRVALAEAAQRGGGTYRTVGCLDACHASNVVVVRRRDGRRVWFGRVLDAAVLEALCTWIAQGAPAVLPPALTASAFVPGAAPVEVNVATTPDLSGVDLPARTITKES